MKNRLIAIACMMFLALGWSLPSAAQDAAGTAQAARVKKQSPPPGSVPKPFLVPHQHGRKDFQRDATLEGQILGEVNFPHSPGPECPYHPVVRDLGARLQHSTHQSCPEGVP